MSTKIHTLVDALGNPLRFFLTPGQAHDLEGSDALLPQMQANILLADKAFDADERVIKPLLAAGNRASHDDIEVAEARQLIDTCKKALAQLTCTSCSKDVWFGEAASPEWVQCNCGDLRWRYGKS